MYKVCVRASVSVVSGYKDCACRLRLNVTYLSRCVFNPFMYKVRVFYIAFVKVCVCVFTLCARCLFTRHVYLCVCVCIRVCVYMVCVYCAFSNFTFAKGCVAHVLCVHKHRVLVKRQVRVS